MTVKLSYRSWIIANRDRLEAEYQRDHPHDFEGQTIMTDSKLKYFMNAHQEYLNDKR